MSEGLNGIDATKANRWVHEIEREFDGLLNEKMSHMTRCKPFHERIRAAKDLAAEDGIPKRALNKILKERALLRSIAELNAELEDDDRDLVEDLRAKLKPVADLPLFGAAIEEVEKTRKARGAKTSSALDDLAAGPAANDDGKDLRPAFLQDKDAVAAEANAAALNAGIKKLN